MLAIYQRKAERASQEAESKQEALTAVETSLRERTSALSAGRQRMALLQQVRYEGIGMCFA